MQTPSYAGLIRVFIHHRETFFWIGRIVCAKTRVTLTTAYVPPLRFSAPLSNAR